MPELPEVETIARAIKPELVGRTILSADLRWARTLAIPSAAQFKKQIAGQEIVDVSRRAKYLVIRLKTYSFLVHLRMSGDLLVRAGKIKPEKHDRLLLYLSDHNYLAFNDTRKFGRRLVNRSTRNHSLANWARSRLKKNLQRNGFLKICSYVNDI